ncbi:nucleoside triphosphate pyrophosphohydrolase [Labilibacter marinus]|uniref:nucleoside triphosphate pyrophosphohydrolase n=1 Tax=Labilibacter marinus TaxID=1477105 RepID=UPI00094F7F9B|nr:nucleoside triphosphate pyrophosphohydrolase [Labilibacter marinus]
MEDKLTAFKELLNIMDELREKCPWDKKQTNDSLRTLTIEETYELADAIIKKDPDLIKKELGDLLLHIVFYAKIGDENNEFTIKDVIDSLNEKLIYRHPHIFSDTQVKDAKEVEENWERLKLKEKGGNKSVLSGVPESLPALVKANRIQDKARGVGFDWENREQVWDKVQEELDEVKVEIAQGDQDKIEAEFGDLLFSIINTARLYGVNPENALERTNRKFISRFNYLEDKTIKQGLDLKEMSLEEMDKIWDEAKKRE